MKTSRKKIDERKKEVLSIEKKRRRLIKLLFSDCNLVEGSYSELLVRCSRSDCRCKEKPCHPVTKLAWYEEGKIKKNKIVRVADRKWVKISSNDYQDHKRALGYLIKLNDEEKRALKQIIDLKLEKYV